MTTPLRAAAATLALSAAFLTGACSDTPEENNAEACTALTEYEAALSALGDSLTADATVEQVRDARDDVASAASELDSALGDVAQDRVDALNQAWSDLDAAITDADSDATLQEAADTIRAQADEVESARADLGSALECG